MTLLHCWILVCCYWRILLFTISTIHHPPFHCCSGSSKLKTNSLKWKEIHQPLLIHYSRWHWNFPQSWWEHRLLLGAILGGCWLGWWQAAEVEKSDFRLDWRRCFDSLGVVRSLFARSSAPWSKPIFLQFPADLFPSSPARSIISLKRTG